MSIYIWKRFTRPFYFSSTSANCKYFTPTNMNEDIWISTIIKAAHECIRKYTGCSRHLILKTKQRILVQTWCIWMKCLIGISLIDHIKDHIIEKLPHWGVFTSSKHEKKILFAKLRSERYFSALIYIKMSSTTTRVWRAELPPPRWVFRYGGCGNITLSHRWMASSAVWA